MAEQQHLENRAIAERLDSFATLLELADANPYSARAYRRAAELIRTTEAPVADLVRAGRARELRGIGRGIEDRLKELVETGEIAELQELERQVSPDLVGLGLYLGIGVRRAVQIAQTLGIRTAAELREAAAAGRLREVPGIGPANEAKLLAALARADDPRPPRGMLIHRARRLLAEIAESLGGTPAGDPRRYRDSSERFAVVAAADDAAPVLDAFGSLPAIVSVLERSERRSYGVTVEGVPVELVVAEPARFGTELVRATGSPEYVAALEPLPDARDEKSVYRALGIPFCPPELREQPFRDEPPPLVELAQIRGDLHAHTTWSDGRASVEEMALAAIERGYEYLAICDHTPAVGAVPRPHGGRPPPPGARDRRTSTMRSRPSASSVAPSATSSRTDGSTCPIPSSRSWIGSRRASTAASGCRSATRRSGSRRRCATRTSPVSRTRRAATSTAGPRTSSTSIA